MNKKHLKNVGPIRHNEPPHAHPADVASGTVARRLRIDVHDDNDNVWQRGPLWPHGMGPMKLQMTLESLTVHVHVKKTTQTEIPNMDKIWCWDLTVSFSVIYIFTQSIILLSAVVLHDWHMFVLRMHIYFAGKLYDMLWRNVSGSSFFCVANFLQWGCCR